MTESIVPSRSNKILTGTRRRAILVALAAPVALGLSAFLNAQEFGMSKTSLAPSTAAQGRDFRSQGLTIDYEGFTEPKYDILVSATEIGRLDEVSVRIGDHVKSGDVVARLEDGLQREAVATAQWRAAMRGEKDAAVAETALAKLRMDQLKTLAEERIARPDELKRAIADWEIAKARELAAVEQEKLRQLELSRYQLQLQRRKIVSPMDGVVAELFHAPGEYITPADPAVIRLVVVDELYAVFNVPVEEIGNLQEGKPVSVFLMSASVSLEGSIDSIAPDIDGESGTIKVKVLLDNQEQKFRPGDRCQMRPSAKRTANINSPKNNPHVSKSSQPKQRH